MSNVFFLFLWLSFSRFGLLSYFFLADDESRLEGSGNCVSFLFPILA